MKKNKEKYNESTVKYMTAVRKYLKEKYGKLAPEWSKPLELLADNVQMYSDCQDGIDKEGLLMLAKNGAMTKNPLIKVQLDCQIQITKLMQEFGLSPKSSSKINLLPDDESDVLKDLLGED